jgi:hypothetical protein
MTACKHAESGSKRQEGQGGYFVSAGFARFGDYDRKNSIYLLMGLLDGHE